MIHPTEEDLEEYRRLDAQDQGIAHLEERPRREPPIGEPCEKCDGRGFIVGILSAESPCPRCHGTKVEP